MEWTPHLTGICVPKWMSVKHNHLINNGSVHHEDYYQMTPQFVKNHVKTNKNDEAHAEAICEAVTRPNMRFVPVKTEELQIISPMSG